MAEKSLVNEVAEMLGAAAPAELDAEAEPELELLLDELPQAATSAATANAGATARIRLDNMQTPLSGADGRLLPLTSEGSTLSDQAAAVHRH
jgi:hypothetical protein